MAKKYTGADLMPGLLIEARQLKRRVLEAFPTHYPRHILEQAAIAGAFVPGAVDQQPARRGRCKIATPSRT